MTAEARFLAELIQGVIAAGAVVEDDKEGARRFAAEVLGELRKLEPYAYPNMVEVGGLRFVYQWDEQPPLLTVMLWDEQMWRDMARVEVPEGVL